MPGPEDSNEQPDGGGTNLESQETVASCLQDLEGR